jgi:subtilase family serine protease
MRGIAIALALAALGASPAAVPLVSVAQADDPGDRFAEPPTWILDHRSAAGVRVSDTERSRSSRDAYQFHGTGPTGYSPAQIRKAYEFDKLGNDGKGQVIAIVSAFDAPTVAADLQKFSKTFKLKEMYGVPGKKPCNVLNGPHPCFQVVFSSGVTPAFDESWSLESSLDVQWAHAIAPGADIVLVEAPSNSLSDLFLATVVAGALGDVVSMSWGTPEFPGHSIFDVFVQAPGVTYVAAAGDAGNQVNYPAVSPYVVGVGGTTLTLDKKGKRKGAETAWINSGGGISQFEPEPGFLLPAT